MAPTPEDEASVFDQVDEPAINRLFRIMVEKGASDLHLSISEPPMLRNGGDMVRIEGEEVLTDENLRRMLFEIAPARNKEEFLECGDTDFAYEIEGLARFRANFFRDRKGVGAVFRVIPSKILSVEDLGLPDEVRQLCFLTKGLVLVTGPTGSGKSTTLSALIDLVNRERNDHIITIEDPIEFVHPNKGCLINQREVKIHTKSFSSALRAALREDPDIILVGEMRDLETISIAIETAETGHLVFGTLHTSTAPSTVDRLIDVFPADRQDQIRVMLSESLKGVIAQTLCRKKGGGRAAAYEILIGTAPVSALIREGKTFQIPSIMQTGKKFGMCTLNDSLVKLVKNGKVEAKEAFIKAVDKSGLVGLMRNNGIDTSFVSDVGGGV
ncbi:MAG: type IV pilus twitching motility protein PilT [Fibrobacteria bacterium]|nr:type IV pilus twitching motility protein PilT [Fibrobacteria bacterium]